MATLTRPGVYVDESNFPTYVSSSPGNATAAFVGWAPRGPLTPVIVNSWRDFTNWYGGFEVAYPPSNLHLSVFSYFSAGGTSAVIVRVVAGSSGPDTATISLHDQETTPAPTLQIDAANPGYWGSNVFIDILAGNLQAGTGTAAGQQPAFTIQVHYVTPLPNGTPGVPSPTNIVETWKNVSMVPTSTNLGVGNYAPSVVNDVYTGSRYIRLTDLHASGSTPATPLNNPAITVSAQQLLGGLDGPGSPPAPPPALTVTDYHNGVALLNQYPDQPFVLNLPGVTDATLTSAIIGDAQTRGNIFMVLDCPQNYTPQAMHDYTVQMSATPVAAIYYPRVLISDPYSSTPGATRLAYPGGFVTGMYIATDMSRGVAKAPAGLGASLLGAYGLEYTCTSDDQGLLTQANVNCLISVPGSGVVIWGARTLSAYLVTRYVPVQRTLIYLASEFVAMTKFAVFEPNDWILWNSITQVLSQFLTAFWQSGGLQGQSSTQAYYVTCDNTINTPQSIQQGVVNVEVGIALQFPAEFVVIKIGQWAGGQSVAVSTQ